MKLRVQFTFLIVVCVLIFFTNRSDTIPDIMEARNLVTAREMVVHGNWLLPTLNGEPRLAKPPLPTWLTAITAIIAGDTGDISSLRIPGALIASLMVFALFIFTREISQNPLLPFLSAVVLATSFLIINMGRSNSWDIFTNSFMLLAMAFMLKGMKRKNSAYGIWCLVGLFWGLTLMSKGPVSFYALLLPFLIGYIIFFGYQPLLSRWREILLAILITLLISLPWPLYVWYHIPENLWFTLNHESTQWLERHVEPFWFYWGFTTQTGIWTAFAIITLVQPYISKKLEEKREYKMILAWLLLTIFLLSVIPEK
ncbi:MAG: glycosyltransferase family 39 protein, partial [Bacteroidetes bacterium]|nr:glycosyltransferase family 39 protein [Bacteroidota bacterium]